jgi:hypothetical protein
MTWAQANDPLHTSAILSPMHIHAALRWRYLTREKEMLQRNVALVTTKKKREAFYVQMENAN